MLRWFLFHLRYWFLKHLLRDSHSAIFGIEILVLLMLIVIISCHRDVCLTAIFGNWNSCFAYVDCHNILSQGRMPYYFALFLLVSLMINSLLKVPWRAWKQPWHRPYWNFGSLCQVKGLLGIFSEGLSCKNAIAYLSLPKGIMLSYVVLSKTWHGSSVGSVSYTHLTLPTKRIV